MCTIGASSHRASHLACKRLEIGDDHQLLERDLFAPIKGIVNFQKGVEATVESIKEGHLQLGKGLWVEP